jgi:hypothetical protein
LGVEVKKKIRIASLLSMLFMLAGHCDINAITTILPKAYESRFGRFDFGGYIKHEAFFDTRQVVGFDGDQCLLFPEKQILDPCGNDINAHGQFNMVPVESNIHLGIEGPQIGDAQLSGVIEGNFFGRNAILNLFGMYVCYAQVSWETLTLKAGQWWHPILVLECYPNTVSFNSGAPMEPFSRNPQVQIKKQIGNLDIIMAALSQIDFLTDGVKEPLGFSSTYLRNSMVPILHFQLQGHVGDHVVGAGVDFKRIVPRLETNEGFKARESLNSFSAIAYAGINTEKVSMRFLTSYIENGTDYSVLGGYAVKTIDPITDERTYTNLREVSWWMDVESIDEKVQPGLFVGVTKNLGSRDCIVGNEVDDNGDITDRRVFGLQPDIDTVFRISPRVRWNISERLVFGAEIEYTRAAYGTIDTNGSIKDSVPVGNTRFLLALYYYL